MRIRLVQSTSSRVNSRSDHRAGQRPSSRTRLGRPARCNNHSMSTIQAVIPQIRAYRASLLTKGGQMRLLLLVVVALTLLAYSDAVSTSSRRVQAPGTPHSLALAAENSPSFGKRMLLRSGSDARATTSKVEGEEERMGVKDVLGMLYNAIKMKVKMKYWLFRGTSPEQVLEKLKVASKTDKNYKYYAKYFYKYYVKYPARQPSNLPTETAENIMKSRLRDWLDDNLSPPQVFAKLGLTGTWASARGQPNYKYFEQYYNMWSDLQVKLSQAN